MNRFVNPQLFGPSGVLDEEHHHTEAQLRAFVAETRPHVMTLECVTCSAKGFKSHKGLDRHGREARHQACRNERRSA